MNISIYYEVFAHQDGLHGKSKTLVCANIGSYGGYRKRGGIIRS